MYMKDGRKLWEKFLIDMCVDQLTEEDYFFDLQGNKFNPSSFTFVFKYTKYFIPAS